MVYCLMYHLVLALSMLLYDRGLRCGVVLLLAPFTGLCRLSLVAFVGEVLERPLL
jgi:hypothetical protein